MSCLINGKEVSQRVKESVKEETIKIGDHTYSKSEVEKRLQGLKEI